MHKYRERIQALHKQLGISADYEQCYGLPLYQEAHNLVEVGEDIAGRPRQLTAQAFNLWQAMKNEATQVGINLQVVSAFRSVERQVEIIQHKLNNGHSIKEILKVTAAPGYSEHHTGKALDLTTPDFNALDEGFEKSDAFFWLQENAYRFQFHLSYPRDNKYGFSYEPWHWAYALDMA